MPRNHKATQAKIKTIKATPLGKTTIRLFREKLLAWYDQNKRDLPWRRNPSPYAVTVSEFMCQQTQIQTVLPYYARWMHSFPDWKSLSEATEASVLKHWEGLGYYRRARNLHALARTVADSFDGRMPEDHAALLKLPGIGPYTAGAIASISLGLAEPVLDGNVERVLTRFFAIPDDVTLPSTKARLWELTRELMNTERPGDHNQAMMELGALVCSPSKPQCLLCPIRSGCQAGNPEEYPVKSRVRTLTEEQVVCLVRHKGKIWLTPQDTPGRWTGFHRLPLQDSRMELGEELGSIQYSITRYRVKARIHAARWKTKSPEGLWASPKDLDKLSLPAPHRKILERYFT